MLSLLFSSFCWPGPKIRANMKITSGKAMVPSADSDHGTHSELSGSYTRRDRYAWMRMSESLEALHPTDASNRANHSHYHLHRLLAREWWSGGRDPCSTRRLWDQRRRCAVRMRWVRWRQVRHAAPHKLFSTTATTEGNLTTTTTHPKAKRLSPTYILLQPTTLNVPTVSE